MDVNTSTILAIRLIAGVMDIRDRAFVTFGHGVRVRSVAAIPSSFCDTLCHRLRMITMFVYFDHLLLLSLVL
jgi:hypothetical protein